MYLGLEMNFKIRFPLKSINKNNLLIYEQKELKAGNTTRIYTFNIIRLTSVIEKTDVNKTKGTNFRK